ncbi:hypothetical protein Tco_1215434 [Tanacetum coccineum]
MLGIVGVKLKVEEVMAISVISISSDSFEDSVGTPVRRVILFGTIPTTILIPTPDDYSTTHYSTDTISLPHLRSITQIIYIHSRAISPFLSSTNDTTDGDTPDTPPLPTHGTPFTEITSSTQRSPVIPRCRVMILALGQPIPHGRPYRYHPNGLNHSSLRFTKYYLLRGHLTKRRRSPMTSVPALPPAEIDECIAYVDALRDREIDARVLVKTVDQEESETGARGLVKVRVERVTHPAMPEDTPEPAQEERAIEYTYKTLGSLREQEHKIVGVESEVTALTEMIAELERDNKRLRDTASVESQRVDRLQRASMSHEEIEDLIARRVSEETEAREAAMNLEPLNENGNEGNGGNRNRGNKGNGNGGNGGNRGNRNRGNGENRNKNHGMNYGGFMPVARDGNAKTGDDMIEYLGHIISENGVATDPNNIKAVIEWPLQTTIKQLRGFLPFIQISCILVKEAYWFIVPEATLSNTHSHQSSPKTPLKLLESRTSKRHYAMFVEWLVQWMDEA